MEVGLLTSVQLESNDQNYFNSIITHVTLTITEQAEIVCSLIVFAIAHLSEGPNVIFCEKSLSGVWHQLTCFFKRLSPPKPQS